MVKDLKAVLFDMDCCLIENSKEMNDAFIQTFSDEGLIFSESELSKFRNQPLNKTIDYIKNHKDPNFSHSTESFSKAALRYELPALKKNHPIDLGLLPLLTDLKGANIPVIVITNSMKYRAEILLNELGFTPKNPLSGYIDKLIAVEDIKNPKPYKSHYRACLDYCGVKSEQTVIFEDSYTNLKTAYDLGIASIAKLTELNQDIDFTTIAAKVIDSFKETSLTDLDEIVNLNQYFLEIYNESFSLSNYY